MAKRISNWYDEPIKKVFAIITGLASILSVGYSIGILHKNFEFRIEKYELENSCKEKYEEKIELYKLEIQKLENKRVEALEDMVKSIERRSHEK